MIQQSLVHLPSVHSGTNIAESVARAVNRSLEESIGWAISTRELYSLGRSRAATRHLQLEARYIWLLVARTSVQRNGLGSDEIVSSGNIGRDCMLSVSRKSMRALRDTKGGGTSYW